MKDSEQASEKVSRKQRMPKQGNKTRYRNCYSKLKKLNPKNSTISRNSAFLRRALSLFSGASLDYRQEPDSPFSI